MTVVKVFLNNWKLKKSSFENVCQWWDVGKVNIIIFCQNYILYSTLFTSSRGWSRLGGREESDPGISNTGCTETPL